MAIYFVQCGAGGPIKIGFSDNPTVRVPQIQVNHWQELTLLGVQEGSESDEYALHKMFADAHIRGEWHWPVAALLAHIEMHTNQPGRPIRAPRRNAKKRTPAVSAMAGSEGMEVLRAHYGACSKAANAIGCTAGNVAQWRRIPAEYVLKISEVTGIGREWLRPDLFAEKQDAA